MSVVGCVLLAFRSRDQFMRMEARPRLPREGGRPADSWSSRRSRAGRRGLGLPDPSVERQHRIAQAAEGDVAAKIWEEGDWGVREARRAADQPAHGSQPLEGAPAQGRRPRRAAARCSAHRRDDAAPPWRPGARSWPRWGGRTQPWPCAQAHDRADPTDIASRVGGLRPRVRQPSRSWWVPDKVPGLVGGSGGIRTPGYLAVRPLSRRLGSV